MVAPSLVSVLHTKEDVSYFFSMGEEEKTSTVVVDSEKQNQKQTQVPESFLDNNRTSPEQYTPTFWDMLLADTSSPPPEHYLL